MRFGVGKSRDEACRACRTARRDTLVTTSATRTTRVQGRHVQSTSLFPEVVPEIDANPEHKRRNFYVRALSSTVSLSSAMLEQLRLDTSRRDVT